MNFGRDTSQLIILGLKTNARVKVRREGEGFWVGGAVCTKSGSERGGSDFKDLKVVQASLVVQWLRICLPMQETRVRALVWEDPTCRGASRPVSHNY